MEEETLEKRFRRRGSSGRRSSSILKTKTPLLDLDPNQPPTDAVIPRKKARISSSRRVSFAETYQVKEFPRDSPHRWMPDPEPEDDASPELENLPDVPLHKSRTEIQGLDKLLTGTIQNNLSPEQEDSEELPLPDDNAPIIQIGPNHTILQDENMDMTDCLQKSVMLENLQIPLVDNFGDNLGNDNKVDGKSFLSSFKKLSTESFPDTLFVPEKIFSNEDNTNMYKLDTETDFKTIVNTSINRYNLQITASQTTMAGLCSSGNVTSSTTARRPLTSIGESLVFKPIVSEQLNAPNIEESSSNKVDGLSFLKKLSFKKSDSVPSQTKECEDKTVVFDGNDMEETEVITKVIKNGDDDMPLIPKSVKVPIFLNMPKKLDNERTVFFGGDNDMEDTEVLGSRIDLCPPLNIGKQQDNERTVFLSNDMEQTVSLTGRIANADDQTLGHFLSIKSDSASNLNHDEISKFEFINNVSKINQSIRKVSDLVNVDEKTIFFDKGNDMEQTEMLTGKLDLLKSVEIIESQSTTKTRLFDNGIMDETGMLNGKIDLVQCSKLLEKNQTVLYKNDDMEETNVLNNQLGCLSGRKSFGIDKKNKTLMFSEENDMEQTSAFTNKIELPLVSKPNSGKNDKIFLNGTKMEETQACTKKIELPSFASKFELSSRNNKPDNRTLLYRDSNDMEETKAFTGKIDLALELEDLDKTLTSKSEHQSCLTNDTLSVKENNVHLRHSVELEIGEEKTLQFKDFDMEQTQALTSKIDTELQGGTIHNLQKDDFMTGKKEGVLQNKTIHFNSGEEMEQTKIETGKLNTESDFTRNKTVMFESENEMEQTNAFTGKLELGSGMVSNKTLQLRNEEMEQTKSLTGKVELGSEILKNKDMVEMDLHQEVGFHIQGNKTLQFRDGEEMEQTKMLTGKVEFGTGSMGNKTMNFKDGEEMEQTKVLTGKVELSVGSMGNKTMSFKDGEEMEQTKMLTGKVEFNGGSMENKTMNFRDGQEMEQTKALTGKVEFVQCNRIEQTKTSKGKFDNLMPIENMNFKDSDKMEETQALTGKLVIGAVTQKGTLSECQSVGDLEQVTAFVREPASVEQSVNEENKQLRENEIVKFNYKRNRALVQSILKSQAAESDISNDELSQINDEQMTEKVNSVSPKESGKNETKGKKRRGILSLIEKLRRDMSRPSVGGDLGIGGCVDEEDVLGEPTEGLFTKYELDFKQMQCNVNISCNEFNKTEMCDQDLDKMVSRIDKNSRRSLGLQTRTPLGKMFRTSLGTHSELCSQTKGSTVKLSDHSIQTDEKTSEGQGHHPLYCSKELFSDDYKASDKQDRNSSVPDTASVKDSERNGNPDEVFPSLGITDEHLPDNMITDTDIVNEHLSGKMIAGLTKENLIGSVMTENLPGSIPTLISDEHIPAELITNSTMMSIQPDCTLGSQLNITTSSGARSIIEPNIDDYLKESMMDDSDGPMTVEGFCRRIQMVLPPWLKGGKLINSRRSISTLSKVDKDSVVGKLEAKYVHEPYCHVYSSVNDQAEEKITCYQEKREELIEQVKEEPPLIFDIAVSGSVEQKDEMREKLRTLTKCCIKKVDRSWKEMKLQCHEAFHQKIKEKREELSEEVNQVVQASDTIQQQICSLSKAASQMDDLIYELEQQPLPTLEDAEIWKSSEKEIKEKQKELDHFNSAQDELKREKADLQREKIELEKEENDIMNMKDTTDNSGNVGKEIQDLEEKIDTIESLLEWHIEDYENDFITFLFYDDSMRLSINKHSEPDNGQKKIASAHVQSLLDSESKPAQKLIHSVILKRIHDTSLLQKYRYITELPELLQNLSLLVFECRQLKRQIIVLSLKYLVTIYEDSIKVEKWSLKTLRKVNIKFMFSVVDGTLQIKPEVNVVMGNIRSEDILEQLKHTTKTQDLIKMCDAVDLDILLTTKTNS